MSRARLLHLWLPPVLFMALLALASSSGAPPAPPLLPDKLLHLAAYTVLGTLFLRAFHGNWPVKPRVLPAVLAVACTAGYGALDEFHQGFVPGRTADPADFAFDLAGGLLAVILAAAWVRISRGSS